MINTLLNNIYQFFYKFYKKNKNYNIKKENNN